MRTYYLQIQMSDMGCLIFLDMFYVFWKQSSMYQAKSLVYKSSRFYKMWHQVTQWSDTI